VKDKVCIIGGGMSQWGRRPASLVDVVQEAAKACFDDIPESSARTSMGFLFASSYCGLKSISSQCRARHGRAASASNR